MEKSPKKFCIPQDIDESLEESISTAPRHFKPGNILGDATSKDSATASSTSSSETNQSSNIPDSPVARNPQAPSIERAAEFQNKVRKYGKIKKCFALIVNPRQRGNPLLKHIRNVPWEFSEIEPDYLMSKSTCALFLSLRYHNLFPNYIHDRLKALGKSYNLRVLLVQVDVAEPNPPLKDLSVISILADCTLMVAWSAEEAGTYLETYKMFENKSADLIKVKQDSDHYSQLIDCLTTIRSINKTDAMVLLSNFKTLKGIVQASIEDLTQCPGMGPLKAKRLYDALRKPLKNTAKV